ncbi:MAG: TolC family protein, partial [Candidatus Cloacimonetes bacterium]|nr:TolC family protein [Candidatus Cloacimonadota bacterium]
MNTLPRHALWIVLLLGFLAPRVKSAERFDLPPGEAIQYMLEHNRDYQKQLADREDARQNVRQTSGEALPSLTSELSWTRIGNISEFSFDPDGSGPESAAVLKAAAADNYAGKLSLQQP